MKKIIFILLLALSVASCTKEEDVNPNCWRVTRVERGINYVGGGTSPSYITLFKDGIYRKVRGTGYVVGDWYCQ